MSTPHNNSPLELLDKQTQLLNSILEIQQNQHNINRENNEFLAKWLTAILTEQRKQSNYLANISGGMTFFIIVTILSMAIGFCVGIGIF